MKYTVKRVMALLIALVLAMPTFSYAGEPSDNNVVIEEMPVEGDVISDVEVEPEVEEAGEIPLFDVSEALPAENLTGDVPESDPNAVVTYCFFANNMLTASQDAREGEEIFCPADPAAPEGYIFAGWALEDGTRLFVDSDADGSVDPVIAHPDPLYPEINVTALFLEKEAAEDPAAESVEELAEEPVEEPAGDLTVEPSEEPAGDLTGEEPAGESAEEVTVEPAEEPAGNLTVEEPAGEAAEEVTEEVAVEPAEEPAGDLAVEEPAEESVKEPAVEAAEEVTGEVTQEVTVEPSKEPAGDLAVEEPAGESVKEPAGNSMEELTEETAETAEKSAGEKSAGEPAAFDQSLTVDGVEVTVKADPGVFPQGAELSVKRVPANIVEEADAAIGDVRGEDRNVAVSYTFDIKVIDPGTGEEYQPAEGRTVSVSFSLAEAADENLETQVYHVVEEEDEGGELSAEKLEVTRESKDTATVETGSFSLYTVELTYGTLEYVMTGGTTVALAEILDSVGLTGEVEDARSSDDSLFSAALEDGVWRVASHRPFSTRQTLTVTIGGLDYVIGVTDSQDAYDISTGCIRIDSSNVSEWNGRTITGTMSGDPNPDINPDFFTQIADNQHAAIIVDGAELNLTIDNLRLSATQTSYACKVSPILLRNSAKLTITLKEGFSNILTASWGGAGIRVPEGCTLIMNGESGGKLQVTGGDSGYQSGQYMGGAGIGLEDTDSVPDNQKKCGSIIIESGEIIAKGGSASGGAGGAAGIGGSAFSDGGNVRISGGTVNATGGINAAGIGGGTGGSGNVTISGGTVNATGSQDAAGIGGGTRGSGNVTISGGTVTATAGSTAGAAIGCGADKDDGTGPLAGSSVTITGGTVSANGNIGHPGTGDYGTDVFSMSPQSLVFCTGEVTSSQAVNHEFTFTVYDENLTADADGSFWLSSETCSYPAAVKVSETGVGKAVIKNIVMYGASEQTGVTGHLKTGGTTWISSEKTISRNNVKQNLYSGYRLTLTGTIFNLAIAADQTGSVTVGSSQAGKVRVTCTEGKASIDGWLTVAEGLAADDTDYSARVKITIGEKTFDAGSVTFKKTTAEHRKSAFFQLGEDSIDYVDENNETQTVTEFTRLTGSESTLAAGWYAVWPGETVTCRNRLTANGNVNLILGDGATLTAGKGIGVNDGSSLTVYSQEKNSGSLIATGDTGCAGIGGDKEQSAGSISLYGGDIHATGTGGGAGIGGGEGNTDHTTGKAGIILIGGRVVKVEARGSDGAAGIGGGSDGDGQTVTISSGTVNAFGSDAGVTGGAGIGGGGRSAATGNNGSQGGTITISGGKVEAQGGSGAAGIGAGSSYDTVHYGNGGTITIKDTADVTARGGTGGAGIGSGRWGADSRITIEGGKVQATGGDQAAGIGQGKTSTSIPVDSSNSTIVIKAGEVTARGGSRCPGIGAGDGAYCLPSIRIEGGKVQATGGAQSSAGIGWGAFEGRCPGDQINIKGGQVTANGINAYAGRIDLRWEDDTSDFITCNGNYKGTGGIFLYNDRPFAREDTGERATVSGDYYETLNFNNTTIVPMHIVTRKAGEGTGEDGMDPVAHDKDYTVPECTFTAPGGTKFHHWQKGDDTTTEILPGDKIEKVENSFTLTAVWQETLAVTVDPAAGGFIKAEPAAAFEGELVTLRLTHGDTYNYTDGSLCVTPEEGGQSPYLTKVDDRTYTFTMPSVPVTVSGEFTPAPVPYVDAGGVPQTPIENYTRVVSKASSALWDVTEENNGWYVVCEDTEISGEIYFKGDINLILADGATLTAKSGVSPYSNTDIPYSLTIWSQEKGTGELVAAYKEGYAYGQGSGIGDVNKKFSIAINGGHINAAGGELGGAGISWGSDGSVTINGGTVQAKGGLGSAGIGGTNRGGQSDVGTVSITGGTVTAIGGENAAGIGTGSVNNGESGLHNLCSINISGGTVHAVGDMYAAAIGQGRNGYGQCSITISGGTIYAAGDATHTGIGQYSYSTDGSECIVTLTYGDDKNVSITAGNYRGTVKLEKPFRDTGANTRFEETENQSVAAIANTTLVPADAYAIQVDPDITKGTVTAGKISAAAGVTITLLVRPHNGCKLKADSLKATYKDNQGVSRELPLTPDTNNPLKYTFIMPGADVTVTAAFSSHTHVYTYSASGAVLTATCTGTEDTCDLPDRKAELTLRAPEDLIYDGNPKTAVVEGEIPGVTTPDIVYTKEGDAAFTGSPTDAGTYTASVTLGDAAASVTYTIRHSVTIQNGSGIAGGTMNADNTEVLPGEKVTLTVSPSKNYVVSSVTVNSGSVAVTQEDNDGKIYTFKMPPENVIAVVTWEEADPVLSVTKTADPTSGAKAGDTITYTVVVENKGNVKLTDGTLHDDHADLSGRTFALAPGGRQTFTYSYTVTQADIDKGQVKNKVEANATAVNTDPPKEAGAQDSATVTAEEAAAALKITKSADPSSGVAAGSTIAYAVTVENTGNVSVKDGKLSDDHTDLSGETFSLAPGGKKNFSYTYTVTQADIDKGQIKNKVEAEATAVRGSDPAKVSASATVTAEDAQAKLGVKVEAAPASGVKSGDTITYTVVVKNEGNVSLKSGSLTDTLGTGLDSRTFELAPGETDTFTSTYTAQGGSVVNTVKANAESVRGSNPAQASAEVKVKGFYKVSTDGNITGGSVTPYKEDRPDNAVTEACEGEKILLRYEAQDGYEFSRFIVTDGDGRVIALDHDGRSFTMPAADVSVSGKFRQIPKVSVKGADKLTYTGSGQKLLVSGSTDAGTLEYAVTVTETQPGSGWDTAIPARTDAGQYYVWYRVQEGEDHTGAGPLFVKVSIGRAAASAAAPKAVSGLVYSGSAQTLITAGGATGGTIRYGLSKDGPFAASLPTGVKAGSYAVYYKAVGDKNHTDSPVAGPVSVKIAPKTAGLTWTNTSFTYDGRSHIPSAKATGLCGSDSCAVTVTGAQKKAGSHTASATGLSNSNYALPAAKTKAFTIGRKAVTVTADDKTRTYGGADPKLTATVTGLIDGDKASVIKYSLSRAKGENAGKYTITPAGETAQGNYTVTFKTGRLTIKAKALTVKAEAKTKIYGNPDPGLTYTVSGLSGSDKLSGTLARDPGESPGTYSITRGTLTAGKNYTLTFKSAKLTIKAKPKLPVKPDYTLLATIKSVGNNSLSLSWSKAKGAEGYDIFFARCGKDSKYKRIATVGASVRSYEITGLKKGLSCKVSVKAWKKVKGAKTYIGKASPVVHAITGGYTKKQCNPGKVVVKKTEITLVKGRSGTISATVTGVKTDREVLQHSSKPLRYYSSNSNVAKVSGGKVTAVEGGACTIYAMADNGLRAGVKITVISEPTGVSFKKTSYTVKKGGTLNLAKEVKLSPSGVSSLLTWSCSNPAAALVSSSGAVKGVKNGSVTITVITQNGKKAKVKITVN